MHEDLQSDSASEDGEESGKQGLGVDMDKLRHIPPARIRRKYSGSLAERFVLDLPPESKTDPSGTELPKTS